MDNDVTVSLECRINAVALRKKQTMQRIRLALFAVGIVLVSLASGSRAHAATAAQCAPECEAARGFCMMNCRGNPICSLQCGDIYAGCLRACEADS